MALYDEQSTIIIPEGAPLMPEFFPDLVAQPETIEAQPATPGWPVVAAVIIGGFLLLKFAKVF